MFCLAALKPDMTHSPNFWNTRDSSKTSKVILGNRCYRCELIFSTNEVAPVTRKLIF